MQEQTASKTASLVARIGIWNLVWMGMFGVLLLTAASFWLASYSDLPTATWRESNSTLPWENDSLRINKVEGYWESSEGNERMMLRTACYPVAEIELGESQGSGMLYIIFSDSNGRQAGDTINLYYDKGTFRNRKEVNLSAEGNKARVFVEAGYDRDSEFRLHQVDESTPLWRASLYCRPEGTHDMQLMGYITIPAQLRK